jgi:hypothetical protein
MLERAGAGDWLSQLDPAKVAAILPAVKKEAQRARIHHDPEVIRRAALGKEK